MFSALACLLLLSSCSHQEPQIDREPANHSVAKTVSLVCAGSALEKNVFGFSADPGKLTAVSRGDGRDVIEGTAEMRLRSTGENSDFEGPVRVKGTADSSGDDYRLEATVDGFRWQIDMNRDGRGRLVRTREVGGGRAETYFYSSNCQNSF